MDLNLYAFAYGSDPEIRMWHENPNSPKLDNYSHDQLWYHFLLLVTFASHYFPLSD